MGRLSAGAVALLVVLVSACGDDAVSSPRGAPARGSDHTTVERVVDGDTIVVDGAVRVRFIGIDTPESVDPRQPVQCFGRESARRTEHLLPRGVEVKLVYDVDRTDRYGRTLAYVYRASDGLFVNAALVRDGYALSFTVPPNIAHADDFVALQRAARTARRGLWKACR
jgi:micrococcal nuclease